MANEDEDYVPDVDVPSKFPQKLYNLGGRLYTVLAQRRQTAAEALQYGLIAHTTYWQGWKDALNGCEETLRYVWPALDEAVAQTMLQISQNADDWRKRSKGQEKTIRSLRDQIRQLKTENANLKKQLKGK